MNELLAVVWLFLPAGVANAAPVIAAKIPRLHTFGAQPIDFGRTFRGKRLLGDNKTVRGFIAGIVCATLTMGVQLLVHRVTNSLDSLQLIRYDAFALVIAASMGCGALLGDALESFFKRQLSIASGKSLYFFDQIDYILGGLLFSLPFFSLSAHSYVLLIAVWLVIHPLSTIAAWALKLKEQPI